MDGKIEFFLSGEIFQKWKKWKKSLFSEQAYKEGKTNQVFSEQKCLFPERFFLYPDAVPIQYLYGTCATYMVLV